MEEQKGIVFIWMVFLASNSKRTRLQSEESLMELLRQIIRVDGDDI